MSRCRTVRANSMQNLNTLTKRDHLFKACTDKADGNIRANNMENLRNTRALYAYITDSHYWIKWLKLLAKRDRCVSNGRFIGKMSRIINPKIFANKSNSNKKCIDRQLIKFAIHFPFVFVSSM